MIELRGYHLHNNLPDKNIDVGDEGEQFVRNTFIKNLETGKVMLCPMDRTASRSKCRLPS